MCIPLPVHSPRKKVSSAEASSRTKPPFWEIFLPFCAAAGLGARAVICASVIGRMLLILSVEYFL